MLATSSVDAFQTMAIVNECFGLRIASETSTLVHEANIATNKAISASTSSSQSARDALAAATNAASQAIAATEQQRQLVFPLSIIPEASRGPPLVEDLDEAVARSLKGSVGGGRDDEMRR